MDRVPRISVVKVFTSQDEDKNILQNVSLGNTDSLERRIAAIVRQLKGTVIAVEQQEEETEKRTGTLQTGKTE